MIIKYISIVMLLQCLVASVKHSLYLWHCNKVHAKNPSAFFVMNYISVLSKMSIPIILDKLLQSNANIS